MCLESPCARQRKHDGRAAHIVWHFHNRDDIVLSKGIVSAQQLATLGFDDLCYDEPIEEF